MTKSKSLFFALLLSLIGCGQQDSGVGTGAVASPSVYAYLTNHDNNTVSGCAILADGTLDACTVTSGFNAPIGITLSANKNFAYVTNANNNTVSFCAINQSDYSLHNCTSTGSLFTFPYSISLNAAGTLAYVTNYGSGTVTICNIQAVTGAFISCIDSGMAPVNSPAGIVLNSAETRAYISFGDSGGTVAKCDVDLSTGLLSGCANLVNNGQGFLSAGTIILDIAEAFLYVPDTSLSQVLKCPVNLDGTTGDCASIPVTGSIPSSVGSVRINAQGTRVYLSGTNSTTTPSMCKLNSDTSFANCVALTDASFDSAEDIALY